jgi:hypothetical protein
MPVAMLVEFPGSTLQQYDKVMQILQLGDKPPTGSFFHSAGQTEGGLRVVDVWESQQAFDKFVQDKLGKALQEAGLKPPKVTAWPVHNMLTK